MKAMTRKNTRIAGWLLAVALLAGCQKKDDGGPSISGLNLPLVPVATSTVQWTGVAVVHDGRVFAAFPRMETDTIPYALAVVNGNKATPFPNVDWNTWSPSVAPQNHFVCVQGLYTDANDFLWVLDAASPRMRGVVSGGAKLLKFDVSTGQLVQRIDFDGTVALPGSYFNDVRVDTQKNFAYITDSNLGAIIVVNLATGRSRRVLDNDPSTKSENFILTIGDRMWPNSSSQPAPVNVNGLTLTPKNDLLYYHATVGHRLYRIETQYLQDEARSAADLASHVYYVGDTDPTDGMLYDPKGNLFLTSIIRNEVTRFSADVGGKLQSVAKDDQLKWPDSFALGPEGALYVTTSQLHIPRKERTEPYRLFKLNIPQ